MALRLFILVAAAFVWLSSPSVSWAQRISQEQYEQAEKADQMKAALEQSARNNPVVEAPTSGRIGYDPANPPSTGAVTGGQAVPPSAAPPSNVPPVFDGAANNAANAGAAPAATQPPAVPANAGAAAPEVKDPCAAYMSSYQAYTFCQDRYKKIERMQESRKKRDDGMKAYYESKQPKPAAPAVPAATPATPASGGGQQPAAPASSGAPAEKAGTSTGDAPAGETKSTTEKK